MDDIEPARPEIRAIAIACDIDTLARYACRRCCVTYYANFLRLRVKLSRSDFDLALSR